MWAVGRRRAAHFHRLAAHYEVIPQRRIILINVESSYCEGSEREPYEHFASLSALHAIAAGVRAILSQARRLRIIRRCGTEARRLCVTASFQNVSENESAAVHLSRRHLCCGGNAA